MWLNCEERDGTTRHGANFGQNKKGTSARSPVAEIPFRSTLYALFTGCQIQGTCVLELSQRFHPLVQDGQVSIIGKDAVALAARQFLYNPYVQQASDTVGHCGVSTAADWYYKSPDLEWAARDKGRKIGSVHLQRVVSTFLVQRSFNRPNPY